MSDIAGTLSIFWMGNLATSIAALWDGETRMALGFFITANLFALSIQLVTP